MSEKKIFFHAHDTAGIDISSPGTYPYTRGIHEKGYAETEGGKLWTKRMFAGSGDATETNTRYKKLLSEGQTGLSVAFDMPTLYGYDTDATEALGEFGTCGVAISSLSDMERLFEGIPLGEISVSMTINAPAAPIWAMFIAASENQGVPRGKLRGTIQNDIFKEYIAQKEYIFPPEPSVRLVIDTVEFATSELPLWNPISISGYHIREAGATPAQELAFTIADGMAYVEASIQRGIPVDAFAPRLSFFFNCAFPQGGSTFFHEIAKFRAARSLWAKIMRDEYDAKNPRSCWMRFHTQTSGASLTAQEPLLNIARTDAQALAAVLGGTQSLHTNSNDEALAVPTIEAAQIALKQQHLISDEYGVTGVVDPLGGSYYVESLTNEMEKGAREYIEHIRDLGGGSMLKGVLTGIELGYMESEIAQSSAEYQHAVERGKQRIVGVNAYQSPVPPIPVYRVHQESYKRQMEGLKKLREERDNQKVAEALDALRFSCESNQNVMQPLIDAAHAYATLGEMMMVMGSVFGTYQPSDHFI